MFGLVQVDGNDLFLITMNNMHSFLKMMLIAGFLLNGISARSASTFIPFLDQESQSNVIIYVNVLSPTLHYNPQSRFPQNTNLISNTNLFSVDEQKILSEISLKYQDVTTNHGPFGTRLVKLCAVPSGAVAYFQYTNYDAHEEIAFGKVKSVKFRTCFSPCSLE